MGLHFLPMSHKKNARPIDIGLQFGQIKPCKRFWSRADPENFVRGGPNKFDSVFFLFCFSMRRGDDSKISISGPSSARQRNAILMAFVGVPVMAQH